MKVVVIAATGRVGRRVVELARDAGHEVTAVARAPVGVPGDVRAIAADLAEDTVVPALAGAVRDADAVLSCLGARSSGDVGVASRGTIAIVRAMEEVGVRRLLVISAAPVSTVATPSRPHPPRHDPGDGVLVRYLVGPLVKRIFRRTYDDLARMEEAVRASSLEWTILRPPRLTDRPTPTRYRLAHGHNVRGGTSISRAAVAHAMLALVSDPSAHRQVVGLAE